MSGSTKTEKPIVHRLRCWVRSVITSEDIVKGKNVTSLFCDGEQKVLNGHVMAMELSTKISKDIVVSRSDNDIQAWNILPLIL